MDNQWKSLNDLNKDPEFEQKKYREFSEGASELTDSTSRRSFIKLLGGAVGLAGLSGCVTGIRKPHVKIRPYAKKVEHLVPGNPLYYATSFSINNQVHGVLAETFEGRPVKIEGNPTYSKTSSSSTVFQQSSVLDLYDPDRLSSPVSLGKDSTIGAFADWILSKRKHYKKTAGKGIGVLIESSMSVTFHRILNHLIQQYPELKLYRYEPVNSDLQRNGLIELTGLDVKPVYLFKKADVVVSLSADFLGGIFNKQKYISEFSERRDPDIKGNLNRLYSFEERFSVTGFKADHHFPVKRSEIKLIASQLLFEVAHRIGFELAPVCNVKNEKVDLDYIDNKKISIIADDLVKNRGRGLVVVGDAVDSDVHKIAFLLNDILGNNNKTVKYNRFNFDTHSYSKISNLNSITSLVEDLDSYLIEDLYIFGGNPVYNAPGKYEFNKSISKAENRIHLTERQNETSLYCNWVLPRLHYLESWNDFIDYEGVTSIAQPVIKRIVDGYTDNELLNLLFSTYKSDYSLIKHTWSYLSASKWKYSLHNGFVFKKGLTRYPSVKHYINLDLTEENYKSFEIMLYPDYTVYDGRYSNNGWLQELPDPVSKLVWGNAAFISYRTAKMLNLKDGDVVKITLKDKNIEIPVMVSPGNANYSISIPMGYGKNTDTKIENGIGVEAFSVFEDDSFYHQNKDDVVIVKLNRNEKLASTQEHGFMEGRPHVRFATVTEYEKNKNFANEMVEVPYDKSLWKAHDYSSGYQWGMAVDLSKCISCNVCITSCQAENNIPIVGKDEILNGREMHWLRTDRYYEGDVETPKALTQPVACLHCENAPCEQVCPVAATVHDDEGLNVMVYNRCVGTRYCADNCPAKVRRFNFFDYHQRNPHSVKKDKFHLFDYVREPAKTMAKQFNPDVTVRMRGVMEKCTYCIQRIKKGTQSADNEDRQVNDGEVLTACQQACPANAIEFGNILDEKSKVSKSRKNKRNYTILDQLLLKARTTYLAAINNPNELLENLKVEENHGSHH
jgi:MoCo/4Fe-4S cofactor protein with predicted Tat translocation signal